MLDVALSPQQLQVINALSAGVNLGCAAAQAGVHRNTIANWRRNSLLFREALADAQYDRALVFRDRTEAKLDLTLETLDAILRDPKASASARLKAALFIIDKACTPRPSRKHVPLDVEETRVSQQTVHPVHNNAQSPAPAPKSAPAPTPAEDPPSVHNKAQSAQSPIRRETPKVGRNEACSSGPGRKYKYCCLNHPRPNTQAAA